MERKRPLGIASYEDKIVQIAVKKILGAIYETRFLNCMHGFRPNRGCHEAIKEVYQRISYGKISYIVDADIKGFFYHIDHDWMMKFLEWNIQDENFDAGNHNFTGVREALCLSSYIFCNDYRYKILFPCVFSFVIRSYVIGFLNDCESVLWSYYKISFPGRL